MATMELIWHGDAVKEKVRAAALAGVNKTMSDCVTHAKQNHKWVNRSTTLETGIRIQEFAKKDGDGVRGAWGVMAVQYARAQEQGALIRQKRTFNHILFSFTREVTIRIPARPYLRPAADVHYPNLGANIRAAYEAKSRG